MLSSQAPNRALRLSLRARHFSTCRPLAAVSPYRSPAPTANPQKKVDKREQSTAAAAQAAHTSPARAVPSPAFNRSAKEDVQPLQAFRQPEMDHSFVGMNGGQIFHEMMLRHDVKHVCE
jgi:acetolactate synthase-1/2/3 large subunit